MESGSSPVLLPFFLSSLSLLAMSCGNLGEKYLFFPFPFCFVQSDFDTPIPTSTTAGLFLIPHRPASALCTITARRTPQLTLRWSVGARKWVCERPPFHTQRLWRRGTVNFLYPNEIIRHVSLGAWSLRRRAVGRKNDLAFPLGYNRTTLRTLLLNLTLI